MSNVDAVRRDLCHSHVIMMNEDPIREIDPTHTTMRYWTCSHAWVGVPASTCAAVVAFMATRGHYQTRNKRALHATGFESDDSRRAATVTDKLRHVRWSPVGL